MAFSLKTWVLGDRWNLTTVNDLETRIQAALPVQFATIASAATIAPAATASVVSLTGTAAVTSITATFAGHRITLVTTSTASLTDGSNLKLIGNFQGAADASISLVCDGTNWYETGRSADTFATIASAATLVVPPTIAVVSLTGTTTVTTITATFPGHRVTLITTSTAGLTDGSNLKLVGNFTGAANSTISLVCDGTNWYETARTAPG